MFVWGAESPNTDFCRVLYKGADLCYVVLVGLCKILKVGHVVWEHETWGL